jgi:hypothetical protein
MSKIFCLYSFSIPLQSCLTQLVKHIQPARRFYSIAILQVYITNFKLFWLFNPLFCTAACHHDHYPSFDKVSTFTCLNFLSLMWKCIKIRKPTKMSKIFCLSMCDVKLFLTFASLGLVLLWQLSYLFCLITCYWVEKGRYDEQYSELDKLRNNTKKANILFLIQSQRSIIVDSTVLPCSVSTNVI